ncbi:hypothetical protein, partial [Hydrogenophaga sp. 70-12]|uniref:hypothetical protein n=1 Tax=Hydrogenophaga sp. 70-12 TaxID=1895769 RepID=UPI00257D43B4
WLLGVAISRPVVGGVRAVPLALAASMRWSSLREGLRIEAPGGTAQALGLPAKTADEPQQASRLLTKIRVNPHPFSEGTG